MKQVLQNMANGATTVQMSPSPTLAKGKLLIASTRSLISTGTERMLIDFGKASYFEKARQQPDKIKSVVNKIITDGLLTTVEAVRSKLSQPIPLGYCNVGVVVEVGPDTQGFKVGDRVVSNGPHADLVKVSKNLCTLIPDEVDDNSAVFTVVASIGLQGLRLAQPTLGESFVVIGVGLIGLLTVQLLKAHGCKVLAIDFDEAKLKLAKQLGAEIANPAAGADVVAVGKAFSRGYGVDGVIITASTKSNDPVSQAANMCRKRGRIVLVGVTGLELNRTDFYEKELSFQVSCSYGPGRYDAAYEEKGLDYPIGFVRWTEQRNFEAVLELMAGGKLTVKPLITHQFAFEKVEEAYKLLGEDRTALGILLEYTSEVKERNVKNLVLQELATFDNTKPIVGVIGAGNYGSRILLPAFKEAGAQFHTLVTSGGINGVIHGNKAGFSNTSTDLESVFLNKEINTLAIVTRHDSHASMVVNALNAGKHVFVEKPLALTIEELAAIEAAYHTAKLAGANRHLMVGFNRRFSTHAQKIKSLLNTVNEPKIFIFTVNAGAIPSEHWTQNNEIGGGRIIGEACHFIDLMRFFSGFKITSVQVRRMGDNNSVGITEDKASIILGFEDGSFGTIHYLANGASNFPKERMEIFTAGRVLQLDNFRKLKGFGWPGFKSMNLWKQDKGHAQCAKAFLNAIEMGESTPISFEEVIEVARISIESSALLRSQQS